MNKLEDMTPSLDFLKLRDGNEDSSKEYICMLFNKVTKIVETGGSKLGLDFLIKNTDVEDRFGKFCGIYHADVSVVQKDQRSSVNDKSTDEADQSQAEDLLEVKGECSEVTTRKNRTRKEKSQTEKNGGLHTSTSPCRRSARVQSKSAKAHEKLERKVNFADESVTEDECGKRSKKKIVHKPSDEKRQNTSHFTNWTKLKEKADDDDVDDVDDDDNNEKINEVENDYVDEAICNSEKKDYIEDDSLDKNQSIEQQEEIDSTANKSGRLKNSRKRKNGITANCDDKKRMKKRGKLFVLYNESQDSYECVICGENFLSYSESVKHHTAEHTVKKHFPCRFCPKVLTCREGWKRHTVMLHNQFTEWIMKCEYCEQAFVDRGRFNKHIETCIKIHIHHCDVCDKKFSTVGALESHKLLAHSSVEIQEKLKCPICEEIFVIEEARKLHEKCHEDPNNQCDVCKKWFLSAEACSRHKLSHDKSFEKNHNEHICQYCNRVFKQINAFHRHLELHRSTNMGEKFSCSVCGKVCKSTITYKHHMRLHLPNDKKPYQCCVCGKGYPTAKSLNIHETTHSDQMHAFCEYCGKGFKEKRFLASHIRRCHTGERPYPCKICDKSFFTSGGRREHILAMHNTTSIICELCGKVYPSRARLAAHKSKHRSSDVKIECEVCKKIFNSRTSYMTHYVTMHLSLQDADKFPQKVHSCQTCKKLFLCKNKLKMHERVHTGEKPELCHVCNKGFADRANLRAHLKIHSDEKPFQCEICLKQFIQKRALRKHMETHDAEADNSEKVPEGKSNQSTFGSQSEIYQGNMQNNQKYYENNVTSVTPEGGAVGVQYVHDMHIGWNEAAAMVAANEETRISSVQLQHVMQQQ